MPLKTESVSIAEHEVPAAPKMESVLAPIAEHEVPAAPKMERESAPDVAKHVQPEAPTCQKAAGVQPTEQYIQGQNAIPNATFEPAEPKVKVLQGNVMETANDQHQSHKDPMAAAAPKASEAEVDNALQEASTAAARTKAFLQQAKQKRLEGTKDNLATQKDKTPKPDMVSLLPAKPADVGKEPCIHADVQQPPKPRGRKKKAEKEPDCQDKDGQAKPGKGETAKRNRKGKKEGEDQEPATNSKDEPSKAKRTSKAKKAQPAEYEPLELDPKANINKDPRDAMDAYAGAYIACDIHALKAQANEVPTGKHPDNPPKTTRKHKNNNTTSKAPEEEPTEMESKPKRRKAKATNKAPEEEPPQMESNPKRKRAKATNKAPEEEPTEMESASHGKRAKATNKAPEEEPTEMESTSNGKKANGTIETTGDAGPAPKAKKPKQNNDEAKARLSRKSCAYKRVLNQKLKEGCTKEQAAAAAREVPYFDLHDMQFF